MPSAWLAFARWISAVAGETAAVLEWVGLRSLRVERPAAHAPAPLSPYPTDNDRPTNYRVRVPRRSGIRKADRQESMVNGFAEDGCLTAASPCRPLIETSVAAIQA
jgi:hypothetical protein